MKTTKYLFSIFFVFSQLLIYSQKNQIVSDEFMYVDYDYYMLYSKTGATTSNSTEGIENFSFNWTTNFSTAIDNYFLTLQAQKAAKRAWFDTQKNLIKDNINNKLGETFRNFNEAKDGLFLDSELKNVQKHSVPLLNKYNSLRTNGYTVTNSYLKELKLLELRKIEIASGNINNSSYKFLKVDGILLGDIKDLNSLNIHWNKILTPLGTNIAKTHEYKHIYEKLNFLGKDFETEIIRLKNNYYNTFNEWDQLNFMQVLLNYEEFKRLTSCGPCLFPTNLGDLYKFQSLDRTTPEVIEDYAIKNRVGGFSIFDQRYIDIIVHNIMVNYSPSQIYYDDSGSDNYDREVADAYDDWEREKEQAINNLLNAVDVSNFAIENLIGELNITDSDEKAFLFQNKAFANEIIDGLNITKNNVESYNSFKNFSLGNLELETFQTKKITLTYNPGKINGLSEYSYTHIGSDGIRTAYKLNNGDLIVMSNSPLKLNNFNNNFWTSETGNQKYWYIRNFETGKWAQLLVKENFTDHYRQLMLLFETGAIEIGQIIGTYVIPVEDVKILFTGKDFNGEDVSRWLAAGMLLVEVVPGGKVFKAVVKVSKLEKAWKIVIKVGDKTYTRIVEQITEEVLQHFERFAPNTRSLIDDALRKGDFTDDVINEASEVIEDLSIKKNRKLTWDEIKALFKRGNDFNLKARQKYSFNEIVLVDGKRLDSYIPGDKIISRKATDIDNIKESTWRGYCSELINKYTVGKMLNSRLFPSGTVLKGKYYLEIPLSNQSSTRLARFIQIAREYGIEILFLAE